MGLRGKCLGLLSACLLISPPLASQGNRIRVQQAGPEDERFRVSTNLVLVHAAVTGKKNKPVMTLKPEDFAIYEDGTAQTIEFFQVDRGREHRPSSIALTDGKSVPVAALPSFTAIDSESTNLTVLLLDYSTTTLSNQQLVREGGRKFIDKVADGHDLIALFAFDSGLRTLQNLTRDKKLLIEALKYQGVRGDAMAGERQGLNAGASDMKSREEALSQQIGGLVRARQSGAPIQPVQLAMTQAWLEMARYAELQYYSLRTSLEDQVSRSALLAIQAIAEGLRPFPGRKSLIFLSQGFAVPPNVRSVMEAAMAAAIRSNTLIYCIDARGLVGNTAMAEGTALDSISASQRGDRTRVVNGESEFDRAALIGSDQEESLLRYLSLSTGGLYLRNSNDLSRSLRTVDEDVHAHYLLAYTPTNKNTDGTFRGIRVELKPRGLKVRARKGYYATP